MPSLGAVVRTAIEQVVADLVAPSPEQAQQDYDHLLARATELLRRKQAMEGTKSESRDLLGELVFTRLRRAFRKFANQEDARTELRAAEWVMGSLVGCALLNDFAVALDRAILQTSSSKDYSFAGRADFISQEEVLQMLGSGKHTGMLSLEKDDNRLDLYFQAGLIAFLDPHRFPRRVLPHTDRMTYREIPPKLIEEAEKLHGTQGTPILMTLVERGFFKPTELRDLVRRMGSEVLYEFLRAEGACTFFYRKLETLPAFAIANDLRMAVTPVLLEGHKRLDDWRSMLRLFPDPDAIVTPLPDMYTRISGLDLSVLEIKMLGLVNGENTPRSIAPQMGLPLYDVYQYLVRFAREGVLVPPGGTEALRDVSMSLQESMAIAFQALDANDDSVALSSALDRVLGGGGDGDARGPLDFLSKPRDGKR